MKKRYFMIALAAVLALTMMCFTGCGGGGGEEEEAASSDEKIIIKVGHTDTEARTSHDALLWFADYMAEETDGKVEVEIYANSSLGDDTELMKSLSMGTVEMYIGAGNLNVVCGEKASFTQLPFVYDSFEAWQSGMMEKGGLEMLQEVCAEDGIVVLDQMYNGQKTVLAVDKGFESCADFEGFKIRVTPSDLNVAAWEALGANPTPISWGEVYTSLTQGTIDGVDHALGTFWDNKFYEKGKYITMTNHLYQALDVVTSQQFMDSLPDDVKEVFLAGVAEMSQMQRDAENELQAELQENLEGEGVTFVECSDEFMEEMKSKMDPVYDIQREVSGADVVDAFIATGAGE